MSRIVYRVFLLACCLPLVAAHVKFVCPTPRVDDSGLKSYPCGYGLPQDSVTKTFTTVQPGMLTVQFEETVVHEGAPYRIALSINGVDKFEQLVLVDHIPHNDLDSCAISNVHVPIPDINCMAPNQCVLQLVQVMTDKLSGRPYCNSISIDGAPNSCKSVYHSCVDMYINGTGDLAAFAASYTYTPPTSNWAQTQGHQGVWYAGEYGTWEENFVSGQNRTVYQPAICGAMIGATTGLPASGDFSSTLACLQPGNNTGMACGVAAVPSDVVDRSTTATTAVVFTGGASAMAVNAVVLLCAMAVAIALM